MFKMSFYRWGVVNGTPVKTLSESTLRKLTTLKQRDICLDFKPKFNKNVISLLKKEESKFYMKKYKKPNLIWSNGTYTDRNVKI